MRHIDKGIIFDKAELTALLEFCGHDKDSDSLSSIHITVAYDKCRAYATDGRRAVECIGVAELGASGEWAVHREFLDACRKLLVGEQTILLEVSGASLHSAQVRDDEGTEVSSLNWPTDAASSQATLPGITDRIAIPARLGKTAACITMSAKLLASVAPVAKAAGRDGVDLYLPAQRSSGIVFRFDGTLNTWTGVVMPIMDGDNDDDEPVRQRRKRHGVKDAVADLKRLGVESITSTDRNGNVETTQL